METEFTVMLWMYIGGLISFASTVIFLFTLDIWIKLVLCSRVVSLFHHTSPWTHTCLQSSPSAHRNGRVFRCCVQTACCYWILNCGKRSSSWNSQMNASCLWCSLCWCEYSKMLGKVVQRWRIGASRFKWQNTKWKACDWKWSASSRWSHCRTDLRKSSHQTKRNCRCVRNFWIESGTHYWCSCILKSLADGTTHAVWWNESWKSSHFLGTPGMFWKWRWGLLKEDHYKWWNWVHHYDPENKRLFMEYCHKESPLPKKFKTQALAGKVMVTVFWNSEHVLTDFLEKKQD